MPQSKLLLERTFSGKQLQSLRVYEDPLGGSELCVELCFVDGQVARMSISSGTPKIVSSDLSYGVARNNDPPRDYLAERRMLGWRLK